MAFAGEPDLGRARLVDMATGAEAVIGRVVIEPAGLDDLIALLRAAGHRVLGPTVHTDAIVISDIASAADLPRGRGDRQEPGEYALTRRDDDAYFGYAAPSNSWKPYLFPPRSVMWRAADPEGVVASAPGDCGAAWPPVEPRALFGVRACELEAIRIQDRVFLDRAFPDGTYEARRQATLIVAVNCASPAATCFCTSMACGPRVGAGADLVLTELAPADPVLHRFVVDAGTERGRELLAGLDARDATEEDVVAAAEVTREAHSRMSRSVDTAGLADLLRAAVDHPEWDDVARRCLSCGNCTMVCPTCFCSDHIDEPNAATGAVERVRYWGSCFELSHSYLHGGQIRKTVKSRYRQWATHKFSTWWEQFGTTGCVGCGRCIAWCPVGIDLTAEIAAIQREPEGES